MKFFEGLGLQRSHPASKSSGAARQKLVAETSSQVATRWKLPKLFGQVATGFENGKNATAVLQPGAPLPKAEFVNFGQLVSNAALVPLTKTQRVGLQQAAALVAQSMDRREANLETLKRMDLPPEIFHPLLLETFFAKYSSLRAKDPRVSAKTVATAPLTKPEGKARVAFEQDLLRQADEGRNLNFLPVKEVGRHLDAWGNTTAVNEMKLVGPVNREQQTVTVLHDPTTNEVWFSELREDRDWSSASGGISPRDVSETGLKNVMRALSAWATSRGEGEAESAWAHYLVGSVIPQVESHIAETKTNQLKRAILAANG